MTKLLHGLTKHTIPRNMGDGGNPLYKSLQGLLDQEVTGSVIGTLCCTLSLISDMDLKQDNTVGSAFNYRDKVGNERIYPSVFYAHHELYPDISQSASFHINYLIIPTGADIIMSNTADDLCDLFINILSN